MKNKTQKVSVLFCILATLFTTCLMAANLFALKQFTVGPAHFTGALLVFPISYIINDVVAEVWGFRRARLLIWMAFGMNFLFVLLGALVDLLPGEGANVGVSLHFRPRAEGGRGLVPGFPGGVVCQRHGDVEDESAHAGQPLCTARSGEHPCG